MFVGVFLNCRCFDFAHLILCIHLIQLEGEDSGIDVGEKDVSVMVMVMTIVTTMVIMTMIKTG